MNIQALGNRTYRLCWELPIGQDGRRRRETRTYHGTWQEAQSEWARRKRDIDAGQATEPSRMTLAELARKWLSDVAGLKCEDTTLESYRFQIERHIIPDLGAMRISKVRPQDLQTYYAKLLREGRIDGKGGLGPRSVSYIHSLLREILGQAVRWGTIPTNPADFADPPEQRKKEPRFWTPEQAARFVDVLTGERLAALWVLAILTGLREGELIGLRWEDVDLETGTLSVRQSRKRLKGPPTFGPPKSERSRRTMSLAQEAVSSLRQHRAHQNTARLALGPEWEDHGLIFCTRHGKPLLASNLLKMQHRLCEKAGVPYIPIHGMRHTNGTALLASGVDLKTVQARLGHQSASFTMQEYVHALQATDEEAARRVEQAVLGKKKPSAK